MNRYVIRTARTAVSTMSLALTIGLAGCQGNDAPVIDTTSPTRVELVKAQLPADVQVKMRPVRSVGGPTVDPKKPTR